MGKGLGLPIIAILAQMVFIGCVTNPPARDNAHFNPVYKASDGIVMVAWIEKGAAGTTTLHADCLSFPRVRNDDIGYHWQRYEPVCPLDSYFDFRDSGDEDWLMIEMVDDTFCYKPVNMYWCYERASHRCFKHSVHISRPYPWRKLSDTPYVSLDLELETESGKKVKTHFMLLNERYRGKVTPIRPFKRIFWDPK